MYSKVNCIIEEFLYKILFDIVFYLKYLACLLLAINQLSFQDRNSMKAKGTSFSNNLFIFVFRPRPEPFEDLCKIIHNNLHQCNVQMNI